jgi:two-component system sensor kinase FixL
MSRMLEYDAPEQLVGLESASFFAPESQETFRREQIKRRAGQASTYDATFVGRNGGRRHVIIHAAPMLDDAGALRGVVGTCTDVTDQKQAEARQQQQTAHLAHVARLSTLGEMLAGIAHEINQPLHAISNFAGACQRAIDRPEPALDGKVREWVEEIAKSALRAGAIVNRLRGFARRGAPRVVPVALNEVIHEAAELVAVEARRLKATVRFDLCPEGPLVQVDRVQIQQVLVNLLKNAFEAMQGIPPDARITTVRSSLLPDRVEVSVQDSGPGVAPENEPRLFEAFFTTKSDGMGLGLAVSRTIIEAHGGAIWADRGPDGGSTFHFTLPFDAARRRLG